MGISPKGHRGIAEGSLRGRREGILAGLKSLARDNPLGIFCRDRIATHTERAEAGG